MRVYNIYIGYLYAYYFQCKHGEGVRNKSDPTEDGKLKEEGSGGGEKEGKKYRNANKYNLHLDSPWEMRRIRATV